MTHLYSVFSLRKFASLLAAASLALTLAACSSSDSNTDSGAGEDDSSSSSNTTSNNTSNSNNSASTGGTATYDAAARFPHGACMLWKPVSEIDHGLVVLVPANMSNAVPQILTSDGTVYATGREHVDARGHNLCNGMRFHYIFGKGKGSDYPAKVVLKVGSAHYQIPNPGQRYE